MPPPSRPRLVRRRPLAERLLSAPADWWLSLAERWESVEWDVIGGTLSWPTALMLNGLFVFVRLSRWFEEPSGSTPVLRNSGTRGYDSYMSTKIKPSRFSFWLTLIEVFLLSVSFLNSLYVFTKTRRYTLLEADIVEPLTSPNARIVRLEHDVSPAWAKTFPGNLIHALYCRLLARPSLDRSSAREIVELNVWDPPIFALKLFCWFSPIQAIILRGLDSENWQYFLPVAALVGAQMSYVVATYRIHLKDKQIIFASVMREYNEKLVNPRLFVRRFDMATEAGAGGVGVGVGTQEWEEEDEQEEAKVEKKGTVWFGVKKEKEEGG
ncbi:hypothetical protein BC937DRAFT_95596 [Endogone sp. FLAS-F59071]|nr:hypothetical protein BC937DRAFT_95596 [Endogone sp. FLAS-F59071]|eukprot:RUS20250.1 hypothetical protein BC937DRAFT_95596 [Endogone sp. FLAS-F59071]